MKLHNQGQATLVRIRYRPYTSNLQTDSRMKKLGRCLMVASDGEVRESGHLLLHNNFSSRYWWPDDRQKFILKIGWAHTQWVGFLHGEIWARADTRGYTPWHEALYTTRKRAFCGAVLGPSTIRTGACTLDGRSPSCWPTSSLRTPKKWRTEPYVRHHRGPVTANYQARHDWCQRVAQ